LATDGFDPADGPDGSRDLVVAGVRPPKSLDTDPTATDPAADPDGLAESSLVWST